MINELIINFTLKSQTLVFYNQKNIDNIILVINYNQHKQRKWNISYVI